MNRVISWLQNLLMRVILTLSLVGIAFLMSPALGYDNSFQAQAKPLTPEATQYQVNSEDSPFQDDEQEDQQGKANELFKENKRPQAASETTKEIGENLSKPAKATKQKLENMGDSVREKLSQSTDSSGN